MKPPRLLPLASVLLLACTQAVAQQRPIEAYVSPPTTFAVEGNYTGMTPAPLAVYDGQRRRVVGKIQPRQACEGSDCSWLFELVLPNGNTDRPEVDEWSYETNGFVTRFRPVPAPGGQVWSRLESALGNFWIRTDAKHVHSYEDLVSVVEDPAVWCTSPGHCSKVSYSVAQEMRRLAEKVSCSTNPYTVEGIVAFKGRRYYRLELPNPLPEGAETWLPKTTFVPVRDPQGEHTGRFSPRGC